MRQLKKFAVPLLVLLVMLVMTSACLAQNDDLKKECETKAVKAASLINALGPKAAYTKISDPDGEFVGKKTHVFCIKLENGSLLAHKVARFVGVNMHNYRDADQNRPYSTILDRAQTEASGWISYYTRGSGPDRRETPALKHMYFYRVAGRDIILCCGYFDE